MMSVYGSDGMIASATNNQHGSAMENHHHQHEQNYQTHAGNLTEHVAPPHEDDNDNHVAILSDGLSDVHPHDDLHDHYAEAFHAGHQPPASMVHETGWDNDHHQQQYTHEAQEEEQPPALGTTLEALTDRFFGRDRGPDHADEATLELAHHVFDQTLALVSHQGSEDSHHHKNLEWEISKAALRLAMATLAERRRDEQHLVHGIGPGMVSKLDGKALASYLEAPHLTLAERASRLWHTSFFGGFQTVRNLGTPQEFHRVVDTAVTHIRLTQCLYNNEEGLERIPNIVPGTRVLGSNRSDNIRWAVAEGHRRMSEFYNDAHHLPSAASSQQQQQHDDTVDVMTIIVRGYDARDTKVDREQLLMDVAFGDPTSLTHDLAVHSGLYKIVKKIYADMKPILDRKRHGQQIVLTGHSLGGMASVLLLAMLTLEHGAEWTMANVLRVFTFGAVPVLRFVGAEYPHVDPNNLHSKEDHEFVCPILASLGLPPSIVYGYVQPWDPVPRMFTEIDPVHHGLDDTGKDGLSVLSSGPFRMSRVYIAAMAKRWKRWGAFRDTFRAHAHQHYQSVGIQQLLMPHRRRYFVDLFTHMDLRFPHVHSVLRVDSSELYSALYENFPLDSYSLYRSSTAIRSLLHHLCPSYSSRLEMYQESVSGAVHHHGEIPPSPWLPFGNNSSSN